MAIIESKTPLRERPKHDHYETPVKVARSAMRLLARDHSLPRQPRILDAGAGKGPWGIAVKDVLPSAVLHGIELEEKFKQPWHYANWFTDDFLAWDHRKSGLPAYDLVIGNPPFKLAADFVRQAHDSVKEGGYVFFLLKLAFLEGVKRGKGLYVQYPLHDIWFSMRRISFFRTAKSSTNDIAFALFLWRKGASGDFKWWDHQDGG